MNRIISLCLCASVFNLSAAVPLRWTVETSRLAPAVFDVVRGETIALEAAFNSSGKPFAMDLEPVSIFWQTNGMGTAWWTAPAVATSNLVRATFTPEMDPGAATVNGFLGSSGSIYRAAFTFRFRHGPGAVPNTLPLPVPVIDFAKVRVLNPPWSGGGGGGVDTNAVIDIIHKTVDGSARTLPPYIHYLEMDDTYPEAAAELYAQADYSHGSCSSVRDGGFLSRNYDWNFDFMPEFVILVGGTRSVASETGRFASLSVCNVGTNLTETAVTSGKWSKWYKALPGHAVDGINENGVVCEVNVCPTNGVEGWTGTDVHCLGGVRYALDHATNAAHAASLLAEKVYVPKGYGNFHYMIADATSTYIVENGEAHPVPSSLLEGAVLTNFRLYPTRDTSGEGQERYDALVSGASITSQWWTLTYTSAGYRASDLPGIDTNLLFRAWAAKPKEFHRGENFNGQSWWQTVHTSVYDITNRTLRIAVQENPDWYTFQVPSAGGVKPEAVKEIVDPMIGAATNGLRRVEDMAVYEVVRTENTDWTWTSEDKTLEERLNAAHKKCTYEGAPGWILEGENVDGYEWFWPDTSHGPESIEVTLGFFVGGDESVIAYAAARRPRYMDETLATSTNAALAAVVTNGTGKVTEGDLMKLGADGRLVKATAGTDYLKDHQDISGKLDKSGGEITGDISLFGLLSLYNGIKLYSGNADLSTGYIKVSSWSSIVSDNETQPNIHLFMTSGEWNTSDNPFIRQSDMNSAMSAKQDALPYPTNAIPTSAIDGLVQKIRDEAPAPGNYVSVSNAAMNAIQAVTNADANLIYTITSDGAEPRFYFTPVGAIDPED